MRKKKFCSFCTDKIIITISNCMTFPTAYRCFSTCAVARQAVLRRVSQAFQEARQPLQQLQQATAPRSPLKPADNKPNPRTSKKKQRVYQDEEHYQPADPMIGMPKVFGSTIEGQPADSQIAKFVMLGAANAGKSTLVNRLTGQKVSIVTERPQTTRTRIMASLTCDNKQMVFLDTPGVVSRQALRRVARAVVTSPWSTLREADVLVAVLDAYKLTQKTNRVEDYLFRQLKMATDIEKPAMLVVNKIDTVEDEHHELLMEKVQKYAAMYPHFSSQGPMLVSALGNVGVDRLRDWMLGQTKPGDWMVPADVHSDMSDLMQVEELVRAQWFTHLHGYLPYVIKQRNVGWQEDSDGLHIRQELVVSLPSEAKILLGANGSLIKKISHQANADVFQALNRPVFLHLQVVVQKDTTKSK